MERLADFIYDHYRYVVHYIIIEAATCQREWIEKRDINKEIVIISEVGEALK